MSEVKLGPGITIRIKVDGGGDVRSVNGVRPDGNGDVRITTGVHSVNNTAPDERGNVEIDVEGIVLGVLIAMDAVDVIQDEDGAVLTDYDGALLLS